MTDVPGTISLEEAKRRRQRAEQPKASPPPDQLDDVGDDHGLDRHVGDGHESGVGGDGTSAPNASPRPAPASAGQAFKPANPNYRIPELRAIDPLEWAGGSAPERRWMVADLVPLGNVTMLGGDGGVGKSLLAMQLLAAAASGKGWLGRETMRCKALGIFAEDDHDELRRRQERINDHLDIGMADLGDLALVSRAGADSVMMDFGRDYEARDRGEPCEFFQRARDLALKHGAQIVVLDALHDFFGGNENSRPQARQFVNMLRGLAIDIDGAVVLCAHPSLTGLSSGTGLSGSTAWNNAVRSRLYLTRPDEDEGEPDRDARVLKVMKSNYSRTGDEIRLRWQDGVFVREDEPTGVFGTMKRRGAERVFLELLDKVTSEGRQLSEGRTSTNYAPRVFARRRDREGFKRADFERAMERLFQEGRIRNEEYGRPSERRRRVVAVEADDEGE